MGRGRTSVDGDGELRVPSLRRHDDPLQGKVREEAGFHDRQTVGSDVRGPVRLAAGEDVLTGIRWESSYRASRRLGGPGFRTSFSTRPGRRIAPGLSTLSSATETVNRRSRRTSSDPSGSVSYTHLTLPTNR